MRLREIQAGEITDTIRRLCIEANTILIDILKDEFRSHQEKLYIALARDEEDQASLK